MAKSRTKVAIWNRALAKIGETGDRVSSEDDETPQAEACALAYDDCLVQLLELRPWPFAMRQSTLAQPSGVEREGWECVYALPTDCVTPLALLAEDERIGLFGKDAKHPFAVMDNDDGDGALLCTDLDNGDDDFEVLEYVGLHEHVVSMPRTFVDALVWLLAAELADSLKKDSQDADRCLGRFEYALALATVAAFAGQQQDPEPSTPSIAARE